MEYAYLLSKKWLSEWEKYVDYENIIAGKEPDFTHFGKNRPGMINDDIIQKNIRLLLNFTEPHPTNVLLKPDLVEGVDYINVSSDAIEWAVQRYGGKIIKRPILTSEDGSRKVEVYLKKVWVLELFS